MNFQRKIIGFKTIVEEEIPAEIFAFLSHPEFFNILCEQEIAKKVEGEQEAIKTIGLVAFGGRLVQNCEATSTNLLVNSTSGAGKDWVCKNTLSILPNDSYIKRTRISPTVFTYWHNPKFEPDWTWAGKVFYLEDISAAVLNSDVFKVMASGGSFATVVINQYACDIEIRGKPVMITTTAAATPNPELIRRFPIVSLNESADQTKAIIKKQARFAAQGKTFDYNSKVKEALCYLRQVSVKVPFAENLTDLIPSNHIIMRTNFTRFMDYLKFSCALFQFQRQQDDEGFFLATGQDYDLARAAILKTSGSGSIPLTKDQQKIISAVKGLSEREFRLFSVQEISAKVSLSYKWLLAQLNVLAENGFLIKDLEQREHSDKKIMVFGLAEEHSFKLLTWKEIEEKCRNNSIPSNAKGIEGIVQGTDTQDLQKTTKEEKD
jgi:hypothetical protein